MEAGQCSSNSKGVMLDIHSDWMRSMEDKLYSIKPFKNNFICRVPQPLRECNDAAYSPVVVSIGPFHRQKHNLQVTVDDKWCYLKAILNQSEPQNDLEMYIKELKAVETEAREYYSEENIDMDSNQFVEMMLLDGCFIIHLFIRESVPPIDNDPIQNIGLMAPLVIRDMLLLENQIPFIVLQCIWGLVKTPNAVPLLNQALSFFQCALPDELNIMVKEELKAPVHLLHLVHSSLLSTQAPPVLSSQESRLLPPLPLIPYVTELQNAGVKFKSKVGSLLEVSFKKELLEMPCLFIGNHSESLFRNLVAFEQLFPDSAGIHFTSYFCLINSLVNTERDVQILRQSGIIEHWLDNDKEVVCLFDKICNKVTWGIQDNYLASVYEEIFRYTQKRWPKWRAKFMHNCLSSPRPIIPLIAAATIILILTFVKTYFIVLSYFKPPKS